jgi:phage gp46-like protein
MIDLPHAVFRNSNQTESVLELSRENYLNNAVMMSLFSDQRVEELPERITSKRGYWADALKPQPSSTGSKLWLLSQAPINQETLDRAIQYTHESLQWLLTLDGIDSVSVDGELKGDALLLKIDIQSDQTHTLNISLREGLL